MDSACSLSTSLTGYWKLDEASTGASAVSRADSKGANTLTDNNTTSSAAGKRGNAAQFTAANLEYLSIADNAALSAGDIDLTFTGWFYLDSVATDRGILAKYGPTTQEYAIRVVDVLGNKKLEFVVRDLSGAISGGDVFSSANLSTGIWYFFVAWHDSVNNTLNLQLNNGAVDTVAYSGGIFDSTNTFMIGREENNSLYMDGRIDEVGFWKKVLTAQERTDLYNAGTGNSYLAGNACNAGAPVEFVSTVKSTGGDYTSLVTWDANTASAINAQTTKVFSHGGITGTIADGAAIKGGTSLATGTTVHVTATQILIKNIVGTLQSAEKVCLSAETLPCTNFVTISNAGAPAIAIAETFIKESLASTFTLGAWNTLTTLNSWAQRSPAAPPAARYAHTAVFDSATRKMYVFGGPDATFTKLNDLWVYDATTNPGTWTQASPTGPPAARYGHTAAFDSAAKKMYVFGGNTGINQNDLWVYDAAANTWTQVTGTTGGPPPARSDHSAVFDQAAKKMYVFGGNMLNDLWVYDAAANTWTQVTGTTGGPPAARSNHSAVFDQATKKMYVFGGVSAGPTQNNDLWVYDVTANTWSQPTGTTGGPPPVRSQHTAVLDEAAKRMYVFGGWDGATRYNDLWVYDVTANTWSQLAPASPPSTRRQHSAVFDGAAKKMYVFGGNTGSIVNELWVYDAGGNYVEIRSAPGAKHTGIIGGSGAGILFTGASGNLLSSGVPHLRLTNLYLEATGTSTAPLINLTTGASDTRIAGCLLNKTSAGGQLISVGAGVLKLSNTFAISRNSADSAIQLASSGSHYLYGNSFYHAGGAATVAFEITTATSPTLFRNNIVFGYAATPLTNAGGSTLTHEYNAYDSAFGGATDQKSLVPSFHVTSLTANAENLHLKSTSTLRGAGWPSLGTNPDLPVTTDIDGESRAGNDIGGDYFFGFPDDPTGLGQFKADGTTAIAVGGSVDDRTVVFKFSMTHRDTSATLTPEIEVKDVAVAFDGTGLLAGTAVAYSGTAVTGTVTKSNFSYDTPLKNYHWRARVKDQNGTVSGWVSFGGNAETATDVAGLAGTTISANTTWTADQTFTNLAITNNAIVTADSINRTPSAGQIVVTVSGSAVIDAGAKISTDGKGFGSRTGTGAGGSGSANGTDQYGGGAGYGASGGSGFYAGSVGGSAYGSATQPTDLGSGGGGTLANAGGAGGGAFKLVVSGSLTLTGTISGNGANGIVVFPNSSGGNTVGGGGSGGSIWIQTGTFAGAGSLTANGGNGNGAGSGGGGGGRIAIYYVTKTYTGPITATGGSGCSGGACNAAGAGTTNDIPRIPNDPTGLGQFQRDGTTAIAVGGTSDDNAAVFKFSMTHVDSTATLTPEIEVKEVGTAFDGTGLLAGSAVAYSGTAVTGSVTKSDFFTTPAKNYHWRARVKDQNNNTSAWVSFGANAETATDVAGLAGTSITTNTTWTTDQTFTNLAITNGAIVTANSAAKGSQIVVTVSGNASVETGASISSNALGFAGDSGPGVGGVWCPGCYGGGGGYGGVGGAGGCGPCAGLGGPTYGSAAQPTDFGSGGGNSLGANQGGGAVKLTISGTLTLNGSITANGANSFYAGGGRGGGSGGSIWITTGTFAGVGSIMANGGAGTEAGGGGGRIAIYYVTKTYTGTVTAAGLGSYLGAAGTIVQASFPNDPTGLGQFQRDGTTAIVVGGTTNDNAAVFKFSMTHRDTSATLTPEIEIKEVGTAFDGTGLTAGTGVAYSGTAVTGSVTKSDFFTTPAKNYHWRARVKDQNNNVSAWVVFGANTEADTDVTGVAGTSITTNTTWTTDQTFTNLAIANNAIVTVDSINKVGGAAQITATISGNLIVETGASISANGRGFGASAGPGAGPNSGSTVYAPGAGYGGIGGTGNDGASGQAGGVTYGSLTQPIDLGSGGGTGLAGMSGSAGGGAVKLSVTGTLTVNGSITANGAAPSTNGGAGSGGSIWVTTGTFAGAGSLAVNGGSTTNGGGGGAGGRIALYYTTKTHSGTVTATGGTTNAGPPTTAGGAGTVFTKASTATNGDLVVDNNGTSGASTTQVAATTLTLDNVTIKGTASYVIPSGATLNIATDFTGITSNASFTNSGTLSLPATAPTLSGFGTFTNAGTFSPGATTFAISSVTTFTNTGTISGVTNLTVTGTTAFKQNGTFAALTDLTIGSGATFELQNTTTTTPLTLTNLTIQTGGTLTHLANSSPQTVNLTVTNNLTVDTGGTLNVNGKGFGGSSGPGKGPNSGSTIFGPGAGYGGIGGTSPEPLAGGPTYGSLTQPSDLGSGGGAGLGGNSGSAGGGAVKLSVTGALTVNGSITANGAVTTTSGGAGSGGSLWLTTGTFAGAGSLAVNGGNACCSGGGGAGGRIATYYTTKTYTGTVTATGGTGANAGGAGTIVQASFPNDPTSLGQFQRDGTTAIAVGGSSNDNAAVFKFSMTHKDTSATLTPEIEIKAVGTAFDGAGLLAGTGVAYSGTAVTGSVTKTDLLFGPTNYHWRARVKDQNANVSAWVIFGANTEADTDITTLTGTTITTNTTWTTDQTFTNLAITNNAVVTVDSINKVGGAAQIVVTVSGNAIVETGTSISSNGKGFGQGAGPGAGATSAGFGNVDSSGGGYGGVGGDPVCDAGCVNGGPTYGSATQPTDLGSGGGSNSGAPSGAGGGALKLTVGGMLTVSGSIVANGTNGAAYTCIGSWCYGSAGGSGGSIWMTTGTFAGTGSLTANGGSGNSRGGGGGRIAVYYTTKTYTGTITAGSGGGPGVGAGTVIQASFPNDPTGLGQFQRDGTTAIAVGGSSNDNAVVFKFSMSHRDTSATLTPELEIKAVGTAFDGTGLLTGSAVAYSGTALTATLTKTDLLFGPTNYHWRARVKDQNNNVSAWVSFDINPETATDITTLAGTTITTNTTWTTDQTFTNLAIVNNAVVTVDSINKVGGAAQIVATISGNLIVETGAKISSDTKGFAGGAGPGAGTSSGGGTSAGGAGYGGNGGASMEGTAGGLAYGSLSQPVDLGSGGGNHPSGAGGIGGGAVKLVVSGTTTLNGTLSANGAGGGTGGGGGSGGSVWITTGAFAGAGAITANGGTQWTSAGGGAGGRIALYYTTKTYTGTLTAAGAVPSGPGQPGAAGTIIEFSPSPAYDNVTLSSGSGTLAAGTYASITVKNNASLTLGTGTSTVTTLTLTSGNLTNNGTLSVTTITADAGSSLTNSSTATLSLPATFTLSGLGTLTNNGAISTVTNLTLTSTSFKHNGTFAALTDLTLGSGGTFELQNTDTTTALTLTNLTIQSGGTLTHLANASPKTANLTVTTLTIDVGGAINVNAKGFGAGAGPGAGSAPGCTAGGGTGGGGYGGAGGFGTTDVAVAGGPTYGSSIQPVDLGSGGGGAPGAAGGGALKLTISGILTNNGTISANGAAGTLGGTGCGSTMQYGGGGSGGSLWITTGTFAGAGTISANGGDAGGGLWGGGGGGGRIASYYTTKTYTGTVTANGGTRGADARTTAGSAGTIYEAGPATQLAFIASPGNTTATQALTPQPQVEIRDAAGKLRAIDNSTSVTLAIGTNPPGNGALSGTTTVTASSGVATFPSLSINKLGNGYTLTASASGLTSATTTAFNILIGALDHVMVRDGIGGSGNVITSRTILVGQTLTLYAAGEDAGGNYITDQSVTWTGTGAALGRLAPTSGASTVFTALNTPGTGTITADHATALDYTTGTITVNAGAAVSLSFTTQPSPTATAGVAFATQPVVTLYDSLGNVASADSTSTVTLTLASGTGALSGTTTKTVVNGVASFTGLSYNKTENVILRATSTPATTTVDSNAIAVGSAAISILQVSGVTDPIGAGSSSNVTVTAKDALGNVATTYTGTVHFTSTDLQATLPADFSFGGTAALTSRIQSSDADFTPGKVASTQVSGTGSAADVTLAMSSPLSFSDLLSAFTYRDATNTTADWDDARGEVRLKGDYATDPTLAAGWMMEEASGTRANAKGAADTLSDINLVTSGSDHKQGDKSASFASASSQALVITSGTLDSSSSALRISGADQPITVSAWVKPSTTGAMGIAGLSKPGSQHWLLSLDASNKATFSLSQNGTTTNQAVGGTALAAGSWAHVVGVYNDTDIRVYVNGLLVESRSSAWSQLTPTGPPAARRDYGALFDQAAKKLYVFGGYDGTSYRNDLWVYDVAGNSWSSLSPAGPPSARSRFVSAFDQAAKKLYVFGGFNGSAYLNDLWVYDVTGNTWSSLSPATPPAARQDHAAAFDQAAKKLYVFGGFDGTAFRNDLWVYDVTGNTWTQLSPTGTLPAARLGHAAGFDDTAKKLYVFAGYDGTTHLADLWVYDVAGNAWTQAAPTGSSPVARRDHAAAFDGAAKKLYVVGGYDGTSYRSDLWVYDVAGNNWSEFAPSGAAPLARANAGAVFDEAAKTVYLFAGFDGTAHLNDLWQMGEGSSANPLAYTLGIFPWASDPAKPNFAVGHTGATGAGFFDGLIDEVAVFNRALSATEVSSIYQKGLASVIKYASSNTAQSLTVDATAGAIATAKLTATEDLPAGTSISYFVSANGGTTWEATANKAVHTFTATGSDLRWKATLSTSSVTATPVLSAVTVDYATAYATSGTFESQTINTSMAATDTYGTISWTATVPAGTSVKLQIATNNDNATWVYKGPDGTASSYYTTSGQTVHSSHNGQKYLRYKVYLDITGTPNSWTSLSPTGPPAVRLRHSTAFDGSAKKMYVFGGEGNTGSRLNDLWVYDATTSPGTWTQLSPTGPPSAREDHSAAFDEATKKMYMFGGYDGVLHNDLWVYDATTSPGTWTSLTPAGGPPAARAAHSVVFDPNTKKMYVFGGTTNFGTANLNDLWVYDATTSPGTWTSLTPTGGPPPIRYNASAVFDPNTKKIYVFGGVTGGTHYNDLWVYDATTSPGTWTQLSPSGPPTGRTAHGAVFDSSAKKMYIFGGGISASPFYANDLWVYDATTSPGTWTSLTPTGGPPATRQWPSAVFDQAVKKMYVFAGYNGTYFNDLWSYDATTSYATPVVSDVSISYNTTAKALGTYTFANGATMKTVGEQSVTATDIITSTITGSQSAVTVTAAAPAKLGFTQQPTPTLTAGTAFTVAVAVQDAFGNTITTDNATSITLAIGLGTGSLSGTLTRTVASGVATFTGLSYNKAETMNIGATGGGYTAATSANVTVGAAAANKLILSAVPSANATTAGTRGAYTVVVQDQFGNVQSSHGGVTINLLTTSASTSKKFYDAASAGNIITQLTLSNGTATGSFWYYDETTGSYTVTASQATLTAATHTLAVRSAAATRFAVTGAAAMAAGDTNVITITSYDAFNNVAADTYTGAKSVTLSGATASPTPSATAPTCAGTAFGTPTGLTFTAGIASCSMRLYKAEAAAVKVTEGSLLTSATDDLDVTVRHGATNHLKFQGSIPVPQPANKFEGGVPFTLSALQAVDLYDNLADGANGATAYSGLKVITYTLSGSANAPEGSATDAYTTSVSFAGGVSSTTLTTTLYRAQATTITARDATLAGTDLASNSITLVAGAVAKLSFFQQPSTSALTNFALGTQPQVAVADQYGNPATQALDQITLAASTTSGAFTPVTNGALTGTALTVTTSNGVAAFSGIKYSYPEAIYLRATSAGAVPAVYSFQVAFSTASDSTRSAGPLTEPSTLSSIVDTDAEKAQVFDVLLTDLGTDGYPIKIKQFIVTRALIDTTNGWLGYIAGASLSDGATSLLGTITDNALTFGTGTSQIFSVSDNTSKTFTLSIYLKQTLPAGADRKTIVFDVDPNDDITVDPIGSTFAPAASLLSSTAVDVIATKFLTSGSVTTLQAGTTTTATIKATDANNNVDTDYAATKSLIFSGAAAAGTGQKATATNFSGVPVDFGLVTLVDFVAGQNNSAVTLSLYKAEGAAIKAATSDALIATADADDLEILVTGGAASKLAWNAQPKTTIVSNAPWSAFSVNVADVYGNLTSSAATVTMAPTGCSASSGSTTAVAAASGIATFNNFAVSCASYPAIMTVSGTATGLTATGASNAVTVVEKFSVTVKANDSVNGSALTSATLKVVNPADGLLVGGLTNPMTGNSPFNFSLPYGNQQFTVTKDAYVDTTVDKLVDVAADAVDGTVDNAVTLTVFVMSVAESLADYRVLGDYVYDESLDKINVTARLEKRGKQVVSDAVNTLKTATLTIFDGPEPVTPLHTASLTTSDVNGNYWFTIDNAVKTRGFVSGRSYFSKMTIVYGGSDLARNVTYAGSTTFNIGISATLKTLTDQIKTDVSGVKTTVAAESAITRSQVTAAQTAIESKVTTESAATQTKVAGVQADATKILTATETALPAKIETARKEVETTRKSEILNRESTVKQGQTLMIRYRTYSGLAPALDIYDPKNALKLNKALMTEVGTTGIYEKAVTFESGWGRGDFTIVASEATNGTLDALIITVLLSDIEEVAGQVSAVLGSTSDLGAVKTGVLDLRQLTTELNSQFTVLDSALSKISGDMAGKLEDVAASAGELISVHGQLTRMAELVKKMAGETGLTMEKLYEVSAEKKEDLDYLKNKTQQLKAAMEINQKMLDNVANKPVTQTWFEFR